MVYKYLFFSVTKTFWGFFAPDLILDDLGPQSDLGKKIIGDKKNIVTVYKSISLSELLKSNKKINEALKHLPEGEVLKLYWAACADQVEANYATL